LCYLVAYLPRGVLSLTPMGTSPTLHITCRFHLAAYLSPRVLSLRGNDVIVAVLTECLREVSGLDMVHIAIYTMSRPDTSSRSLKFYERGAEARMHDAVDKGKISYSVYFHRNIHYSCSKGVYATSTA
jgi:hypothetical protein